MKKRTVGILLFNEVEVLDFAGPYEVFSLYAPPEEHDNHYFHVVTISETGELINARNGLKVKPDYSFSNHPQVDIVLVPGGKGAEVHEIHNQNVIAWIKQQSIQAEVMASVCTGALLLAKAGLLDGRSATTHWMDIDRLEGEFPLVKVKRGVKFVDEGDVITSGGIAAGINMSFHLISRLYGKEAAINTAKNMEYEL
ncbi:DJ-1/PfpI family protein [Niallia sp. MER 6]|uniref:DJ-1/PfpI family protein n=1 Tax=Niallia sp. MER 6 TaxID=2939567 RepID=UPI0020406FFC|nr:DJ-1/PfpI family protein [Niallia sp. MER 6]MCM3030438.1 DJ-1/PfpI family protein [Niallia sp. MER 6]